MKAYVNEILYQHEEIQNNAILLQISLEDADKEVKNKEKTWLEQHAAKDDRIQKLASQIESLQRDLQIYQLTNEEMQNKNTALEQQIVLNLNDGPVWQEMRKAQGLYNQLREQFREKSEVLSQTRSDLFHIQEELLKLKMEQAEGEHYYYSGDEEALIKHIQQMEISHRHTVDELKYEIDLYMELIKSLLERSVINK